MLFFCYGGGRNTESMTNEILQDINTTVAQPIITKNDVRAVLILARKLIEILPQTERSSYDTLQLYYDWSAHIMIDRSDEGVRILQNLNTLLNMNTRGAKNNISNDLSMALSLNEAHRQLNSLLVKHGNAANSISHEKWSILLPLVAAIIKDSPLQIGTKKKFAAARDSIVSRPIIAQETLVSLTVTLIPANVDIPVSTTNPEVFAVSLNLTNANRVIVSIVDTTGWT